MSKAGQRVEAEKARGRRGRATRGAQTKLLARPSVTPGSVAGVLVQVLVSWLLSLYANRTPRYEVSSRGARQPHHPAHLRLWIAMILLLGGAKLERAPQTSRPRSASPPASWPPARLRAGPDRGPQTRPLTLRTEADCAPRLSRGREAGAPAPDRPHLLFWTPQSLHGSLRAFLGPGLSSVGSTRRLGRRQASGTELAWRRASAAGRRDTRTRKMDSSARAAARLLVWRESEAVRLLAPPQSCEPTPCWLPGACRRIEGSLGIPAPACRLGLLLSGLPSSRHTSSSHFVPIPCKQPCR